jgi:hypothetical protein
MKGKKKLYLYPILAVFFFVQLTGLFLPTEARTSSGISTGIAAQGGEWQLLPLQPFWYQPPPPGDGNITISKVNRFDAGGGDVEATIQQSSERCRERDKIEVIGFKWTFTAPINRLRPGAMLPVDIEVRLLRGNPPCSEAEGRTELFLHRTDSGVDPPFMPFKGIWQPFSDAYAPGVPRANFYLQPPGAERGKSGFKINESTPAPMIQSSAGSPSPLTRPLPGPVPKINMCISFTNTLSGLLLLRCSTSILRSMAHLSLQLQICRL